MKNTPILKPQELMKFLETIGFKKVRQKGSHVRFRCEDGRVTTVPFHKGKDIPKGLLRKIVYEDLGLTMEEFIEMYRQFVSK